MRFILGGFGQGKLTYALESYCRMEEDNYKTIQNRIFDENNFRSIVNICTIEKEMDMVNKCTTSKNEIIIWNHFNRCVKKMMEAGQSDDDIRKWVEDIINSISDIIIICDEVGNGIIPIDENEVRYRELTGRLGIMIAKRAVSVERIICGIAQRLK